MSWLLAFLRYPLGDGFRARQPALVASPWSLFHVSTKGFDPARKMARRAHEKRRALVRATAQQMRSEMGLPPDNRLRG